MLPDVLGRTWHAQRSVQAPAAVTGLIDGRFVRMACPWCGSTTYAVPGTAAMACASHGRAWYGAGEPARPTPGAENWRRLGQTGVAAYPHTPRAVTELEGVDRAPAPFVLQGRRPVLPVDGAPTSVGQLVRREGGAAFYWAALWREGGETRPAARRDANVEEGGKARARVSTPPLDRWVLEEQIVVVWESAPGVRGFRIWRRRGRSGWSVRCTWRRDGDALVIAKGAA